jgi:hypothetical protein
MAWMTACGHYLERSCHRGAGATIDALFVPLIGLRSHFSSRLYPVLISPPMATAQREEGKVMTDRQQEIRRGTNNIVGTIEHEMTIADAITDAFSVVEELASEMQEWGDNIEEKFSSTEKYERIREAQYCLESASQPSVPDSLNDAKVIIHLPKMKKRPSRNDRLTEAHMDHLESLEENEDAKGLRDELDTANADLEAVEFPGMFG